MNIGNHESECHDPACVVNPRKLGLPLSNFTAFNARWKMPSPESGGVDSMWYRCAPRHVLWYTAVIHGLCCILFRSVESVFFVLVYTFNAKYLVSCILIF